MNVMNAEYAIMILHYLMLWRKLYSISKEYCLTVNACSCLKFSFGAFSYKGRLFFSYGLLCSLTYYIGNLAGVQCVIRGNYPKSGRPIKKVKIFRAFSLVASVAEKILTSYT